LCRQALSSFRLWLLLAAGAKEEEVEEEEVEE